MRTGPAEKSQTVRPDLEQYHLIPAAHREPRSIRRQSQGHHRTISRRHRSQGHRPRGWSHTCQGSLIPQGPVAHPIGEKFDLGRRELLFGRHMGFHSGRKELDQPALFRLPLQDGDSLIAPLQQSRPGGQEQASFAFFLIVAGHTIQPEHFHRHGWLPVVRRRAQACRSRQQPQQGGREMNGIHRQEHGGIFLHTARAARLFRRTLRSQGPAARSGGGIGFLPAPHGKLLPLWQACLSAGR